MTQITLDLPDDLAAQLQDLAQRDRLQEILTLSLRQPALPAHIYRYILGFLSSQPSPEDIANFRPTPEMQERLALLLSRSQTQDLTHLERQELDEYERIEHLIILLKSGNLPYVRAKNE